MDEDLFIGFRVRLNSIQNVAIDPRAKVTHKPPKGKVFVAIIVGVEEKNIRDEDDILQGPEVIKRLRNIISKNPKNTPIEGCEVTNIQGVMG